MVRRRDLEKFASQNIREGRLRNRTVGLGSLSHTGTYSIDEVDRTITLRLEAGTFPNQDGNELKRAFTLTPNELTYVMFAADRGVGSSGSRLATHEIERAEP